MTYPVDMPTVEVTVGPVRHLETSKDLQFRAIFEAVHPTGQKFPGLIWEASSERFMAITQEEKSSGENMSFVLPATNAEGWKNFEGAPIDTDGGNLHTHAYQVRLEVYRSGTYRSSVILGPVFLPEGVSPVDLDDLISIPQEPGTPIDFPDVWGALVQRAEAAALAAQQSAEDAESAAELVRDNSIVDASITGQDLVFEKHDLSTINVGRVVGLSAYEQSGFPGTIEQWLDSLEGASSLTGNGPPAITGRKIDQPYLDADTGDIYSWSGSSWTLVGNIASVVPGPPNTLTAGTITQIPAGGQPTFSITGTAPDQTLNLGLVDGSPTAFELRGEGFPGTGSNATATNAASPGTYYTDTVGTNGAWRWIKTQVGTGAARWKVIVGDTGPRTLVSWVSGEVTYGVMPAGWEPSTIGSGAIVVRRINESVLISVGGITCTTHGAQLGFLLPAGFAPVANEVHSMPVNTESAATIAVRRFSVTASGHIYPFLTAGDRITQSNSPNPAIVRITASQIWPTVLPGTAV